MEAFLPRHLSPRKSSFYGKCCEVKVAAALPEEGLNGRVPTPSLHSLNVAFPSNTLESRRLLHPTHPPNGPPRPITCSPPHEQTAQDLISVC